MRQKTIDKAMACFPATKPQLVEKLGVTYCRAQQLVKQLKAANLIKPSGVVLNASGSFVQRFVPIDYPEDNSAGLLDVPQDKKGQTP